MELFGEILVKKTSVSDRIICYKKDPPRTTVPAALQPAQAGTTWGVTEPILQPSHPQVPSSSWCTFIFAIPSSLSSAAPWGWKGEPLAIFPACCQSALCVVWLDPRARLGIFRSHLCLVMSVCSICLCLSAVL